MPQSPDNRASPDRRPRAATDERTSSALPPARYIRAEHVVAAMASFGRHRLGTLGSVRTVVLSTVGGAFITAGALLSVLLGAGVDAYGPRLLVMGLAFSAGFFFVVLSEALLYTEANVVLPAGGPRRPHRVEDALPRCRHRGRLDACALSGVLANWLVGMAAFFAFMGRTIVGKYIPVALAVTTFVAAGFQHSPANMGYFSLAIASGQGPGWPPALWWNVVPAGVGNMLGGALLVALPFWYAFRFPMSRPSGEDGR